MQPLTINYDSPAELKAFLEKSGIGMRKRFGQNFLINKRIREKLIEAMEIIPGESVWEIGPGLGAMSCGLLDCGARLTAFEIDPAFCGILRELFSENSNFTLIEGNALKTWPLVKEAQRQETRSLFGNLPYNIGAALLADFIERDCLFSRMVVTVQRETAQRMAAKPGSKDYSSFSVLFASSYRIKKVALISGQAFYPVPRVDSQALRLDLLPKEERVSHSPLFQGLVRSLFASRRKTIKNNLINFASSVIMGGMGEKAALEALGRSGIKGERRAETLSIQDFSVLSQALEEIRKNGL
ncbi:MAG: 16S rRNA (adenine(1518)-N(6)/adenine(1519)-N(6))-dimethyltransferase RsmA [Treponema sp.]|nr:16S rRNA (adenine(1518)-N(6)/adenine(1519)-N(6))-dimethyltransferase RsmA [Treponema sp.]